MSLEKKVQEHREALKQRLLDDVEAGARFNALVFKNGVRAIGIIFVLWGFWGVRAEVLKWKANGGSLFETRYFFYVDQGYGVLKKLGLESKSSLDSTEDFVNRSNYWLAGWSVGLFKIGCGLFLIFARLFNIKVFGRTLFGRTPYEDTDMEAVKSSFEERPCEIQMSTGICERCGGRVSYPRSMEGQEEDCPSCGQNTILVDASDFI